MALILNILNFVLGGFAVTFGWLFATIISAVLIITLPYSRIPTGLAHFKLVGISLFPVGQRVVSKELAQLARSQQAGKEFNLYR